MFRSRSIIFSALVVTVGGLFVQVASAEETKPVSFSRDVAPILARQCQTCHGPEKSKGHFRLDSFDRMMTPGKSKDPTITPGLPQKSAIYRLITASDPDDRMPQKADPLPASQVQLIHDWIESGAKFDGSDPTASLSALDTTKQNSPAPKAYTRPVPITALAFSPDGKTLAASGYNEITLWDATDGHLISRLGGVPRETQGLSWSPDGQYLAAACGTPGLVGQVWLFHMSDPPVGKAIERIADAFCTVCFSPDGTRLAAGGSDNAIHLYEIPAGKPILRIEQHADWVTDVAFSPDGERLVSASRDKSCRVFDAKTGAAGTAFLDSQDTLYAVAWSADGKRIYSAGREIGIRVWNSANAKELGQITNLSGDVFRLKCTDNLLLATTGDSVREYSAADRSLIRKFSLPDWAYSLTVDAAHHRIAAGCYSGQVRVWDLKDGKEMLRFLAAPGLTTVNDGKEPRTK